MRLEKQVNSTLKNKKLRAVKQRLVKRLVTRLQKNKQSFFVTRKFNPIIKSRRSRQGIVLLNKGLKRQITPYIRRLSKSQNSITNRKNHIVNSNYFKKFRLAQLQKLFRYTSRITSVSQLKSLYIKTKVFSHTRLSKASLVNNIGKVSVGFNSFFRRKANSLRGNNRFVSKYPVRGVNNKRGNRFVSKFKTKR